MTEIFPALADETRSILARLPEIIDMAFPLPSRFRRGLSHDVAELSRLLTSGRDDRSGSYLGKPALLSAYLRYFMPWNIYRLCRLFRSLPPGLKAHDCVNDLGAGPLTLAASLWISRPELRSVPLEFRCVDRTPAVLEAGKVFFEKLTATLSATACPWSIRTIRGEIKRSGALSIDIRGKPANLSAAINVYNELFWDMPPGDSSGTERFAEKQARLLSSLTDKSGSILVVEPGIPRSGNFISLLRSGFLGEGRQPLSPCVHGGPCALSSGRAGPGARPKWCHFAFDTEDAPAQLHKLSAAANIPKERAVLSFILAGPVSPEKRSNGTAISAKPKKIRIISDAFPVNNDGKNKWGRYGCGDCGMVLVTGSRDEIERLQSGSEEGLTVSEFKDRKSGAMVAPITHHHFR